MRQQIFMFLVMKTIFVLGRKTLPHTIIAQIMASSHPTFETYTKPKRILLCSYICSKVKQRYE